MAMAELLLKNSTNVRSVGEGLNGLLRLLHPTSRAERVADLFMTPNRVVTPPMLPDPGGPSTRLLVPDHPTPLYARSWQSVGESRGTVLLVHGWDSTLFAMGGFVAPLLADGFRVVAFDAPGHGRSFGDKVSLIDFAAATLAVAKAAGPLAGVIGHSLGAASVMLALAHGLQVDKVVLIGTPADPAAYLRDCARAFGLTAEEKRDLFAIMDARLPIPISTLSLAALAGDLTTPALFLHATDDRLAPVVEALHTTGLWRNAAVRLFDHLGHRRILRAKAVQDAALSFLSGSST